MSRPRKLVPTLQHHKASGQAFVRLADGSNRYLGKWNSKQARTAYGRLVGELTATGAAPAKATRQSSRQSDGPTVAEVALAWVEHAQRHYVKNGKSTGTLYSFRVSLKALRELYGDTSAADFGPLKLETVRARLAEPYFDPNQKRERRRSRSIVNARTRGLVSVFKWAASRELVPASVPQSLAMLPPIRGGRTDLPETEAVGPVADATVEATLTRTSAVVASMVRLARVTGMRPGEVCLIRPGDVDRSGDIWTFQPMSHKLEHHDKERLILIGPKGQDILRPYLLRPADQFCFSPAESVRQHRERRRANRKTPEGQGNGPGTNVRRKPSIEPGDCFTVASFRRAIQRAAKQAGVESWHPNQLRHAFATEARVAGGLEAVQGLLGHSNLQTSQVYAERQSRLAHDIALKLG